MRFLDKVFIPSLATHKIKLDMNDNKVSPKEKAVRFRLMLSIDQEMSWGFIGGTSQGDPIISGVETILYFDSYHYFTLKYIVGKGSNNHEEFYALWVLLKKCRGAMIKSCSNLWRLKTHDRLVKTTEQH